MARSPEAYIRGTTRLFYEWLARHSLSVPEGPAVWICGDCHLGNLGGIGGSQRRRWRSGQGF
ncbi:DUF2252 family protein [Rhizobium sp. RCAM05973]|nr:DUF2252 family protein [Rhizobium sp. RCAM05973]